MKAKHLLLAVAFLGLTTSTNAQSYGGIKRYEWNFRPEITTDCVWYSFLLQLGFNAIPGSSDWWRPYTVLKRTYLWGNPTFDGVKAYQRTFAAQLFGNFNLKSYSIGYTASYMSKEKPVGLFLKVAYQKEGIELRMPGDDDKYTTFIKHMVVPEAQLRFRFGSYMRDNVNVLLNVGATYDYTFSAKGTYKDKKTVNNGVSGKVGLGIGFPESHVSIDLGVSIPFYDYFNKDYTPDGELYPYKDVKLKKFTPEVTARFGF